MSFSVNLYSAFAKPENSMRLPSTNPQSFECKMVEPCGVITPRISLNIGTHGNPSSFNYAYIPEFRRYYWINEWTWDSNRWYADMEVDVLGSWKSNILQLQEYVTRSASRDNNYVVDNMYPATARVTKQTQQSHPWPASSLSNGAYVIGVLGANNTTVGGVSYYVASADDLNNLVDKMMSNDSWIDKPEEISSELLRCLVNPMQYITSVMWFPMRPWNTGSSSRVNAGWWFTGVGLPDCQDSAPFVGGSLGTVPSHPQADRGLWLNRSPYTELTVVFPPFGKFSLDTSKYLAGTDVHYSIATDAISGMSVLYIYTKEIGDGDMFIAKVGVDLSVGQSNSSVLGAAGSAISALSKGNPNIKMYGAAGASHGARNSYSMLGDAISSLNPEINVVGQNGGTAMYKQPATLTALFHHITDEDNLHFGKPLCQKVTLGSLSGFCQVADFDANLPCTLTEHQKIKSFMERGVFIE